MEWVNLAHNNTREIESVKKRLKSYLPVFNAEPIAKSKGDKSSDEEDESSSDVDLTIKNKRILNRLK